MREQPIGVEADASHVDAIARGMRYADRESAHAVLGLRPAGVVRAAMKVSEFSNVLMVDGELLAMFGARVVAPGVAQPWALTTAWVYAYPRAFWAASKYVVGQMAARYGTLVQCIDARHEQALRWARRLGFVIDENSHACGRAQLPFYGVTYRAGEHHA